MSPAPPVTFGVPEHALPAWAELHQQITRAGSTPCADASVRDAWLGSAGEQETAARSCLDCPAMAACHDYATAADERIGVWGGRTESERAARRKAGAT